MLSIAQILSAKSLKSGTERKPLIWEKFFKFWFEYWCVSLRKSSCGKKWASIWVELQFGVGVMGPSESFSRSCAPSFMKWPARALTRLTRWCQIHIHFSTLSGNLGVERSWLFSSFLVKFYHITRFKSMVKDVIEVHPLIIFTLVVQIILKRLCTSLKILKRWSASGMILLL
jgi:hypothetical protein